jgi:AraC family transcriptional regulator
MDSRSQSKDDYVRFMPPDLVSRHFAEWPGLRAEVITARLQMPFNYRLRSNQHVLIASECSERDDGETIVEGLPKSTRRSISHLLTFVPAGHELYGWQRPRVLTRVNYLYIDPRGPLFDEEWRFAQTELRPRMFFFDAELWRIAEALKAEAVGAGAGSTRYGEALGILLGYELIRLNNGIGRPAARSARGGLSGWQQKKVADFIEAHLTEEVRLSTLARLVDLSPFHFARAFKQSFGVPPLRYHSLRRIERAKALLEQQGQSVTEVALALGFAETSSFSAAFRKTTGTRPSDYRRNFSL